MYTYILPASIGVGLITAVALQMGMPEKRVESQAAAELHRYRVFVSTADTFFKATPAPASTRAYRWADIKAAAPPALVGAPIRADWKVVRKADGEWVGCTELSEEAGARVSGLFPTQTNVVGSATVPVLSGIANPAALSAAPTGTFVVIGNDAAQVTPLSDLCNTIS